MFWHTAGRITANTCTFVFWTLKTGVLKKRMQFIIPEIMRVIGKQHILRKVVAHITIASVFFLEEKEVDLFLNSGTRSEWDFLLQNGKECNLIPTKKKKKKKKKK